MYTRILTLISTAFLIGTLTEGVFASESIPTTLRPSLTTQMARQEQINKKNILALRLQEQSRLRQEAKNRTLALQTQRNAIKNTIAPLQTVVSATPTSTTPVISRPPQITQPQIVTPVLLSANIPSPQNVDISRVRTAWISWYNDVRRSQGLAAYAYDSRLDMTAYDWNVEFADGKGQNHHRRNPGDAYYDFNTIDKWFIDRGVNAKVVNRAKNTENVGYGTYSCNSSDCTDALIRSIRSTFDFFMSEKGKSYDAHYRSIVQPNFSKIGLSVIVVPSERRYYLTVHYITE